MRLCKPTVWIILKNVFYGKNEFGAERAFIYYVLVYTMKLCIYVRMNQPVLLLYFEYRFSIRDDSVRLYAIILSEVYWLIFTVYSFWERKEHMSKLTLNSPVDMTILVIFLVIFFTDNSCVVAILYIPKIVYLLFPIIDTFHRLIYEFAKWSNAKFSEC